MRVDNRHRMLFCPIQTHSSKQDLLEQWSRGVPVVIINLSVQRGIERSVIAPLRAKDPYRGPVEGEGGGGTVSRG